MPKNDLAEAEDILSMLKLPDIERLSTTKNRKTTERKLILMRRLTAKFIMEKEAYRVRLAKEANTISLVDPCIAISYLNIAACGELAERFALEYLLKYKKKKMSLISLINAEDPTKNHLIVLIGSVLAPKALCTAAQNKQFDRAHWVTMSDFFDRQDPDVILVDPFINFAAPISSIRIQSPSSFHSYCDQEGITFVSSVRSFDDAFDLFCNAPMLEAIAKKLAAEINSELNSLTRESIQLLNKATLSANDVTISRVWKYDKEQACFYIKLNDAQRIQALNQSLQEIGVPAEEIQIKPGKKDDMQYLMITDNAIELYSRLMDYLFSRGPSNSVPQDSFARFFSETGNAVQSQTTRIAAAQTSVVDDKDCLHSQDSVQP